MRLPAASIRVRLTLWYAAALGLLLLGFALGVYFFVQRSLTRQLDQLLDEQFKAVGTALRGEPDDLEELAQLGAVPLFEVTVGEQLVYRTAGWGRAGLDGALGARRSRPVWSAAGTDARGATLWPCTCANSSRPMFHVLLAKFRPGAKLASRSFGSRTMSVPTASPLVTVKRRASAP